MSEDEIIDTITKQLKRKADYDTGVHLPQLAVEGLLDLYQKEKDSNQWLLKAFDESRNNNIELSKELQQEKEKNKEFIDLHYVPYEQYVTTLNEVNKKWKDKIRAKIEELEDLNSKFSQRVIKAKEVYLTELVQNILKELLD